MSQIISGCFYFWGPPRTGRAQREYMKPCLNHESRSAGEWMEGKSETCSYLFLLYITQWCDCCTVSHTGCQRLTDLYGKLSFAFNSSACSDTIISRFTTLEAFSAALSEIWAHVVEMDSHTVEWTELCLYTKYSSVGKSVSKWNRRIRAQQYLFKTNLWHPSVIVSPDCFFNWTDGVPATKCSFFLFIQK